MIGGNTPNRARPSALRAYTPEPIMCSVTYAVLVHTR